MPLKFCQFRYGTAAVGPALLQSDGSQWIAGDPTYGANGEGRIISSGTSDLNFTSAQRLQIAGSNASNLDVGFFYSPAYNNVRDFAYDTLNLSGGSASYYYQARVYRGGQHYLLQSSAGGSNAWRPGIQMSANATTVAYKDSATTSVVKYWDGTQWVQKGGSLPSGDICLNRDGNMVAIGSSIKSWDGASWTDLQSLPSGFVQFASASDRLLLRRGSSLEVYELTGGQFQQLGSTVTLKAVQSCISPAGDIIATPPNLVFVLVDGDWQQIEMRGSLNTNSYNPNFSLSTSRLLANQGNAIHLFEIKTVPSVVAGQSFSCPAGDPFLETPEIIDGPAVFWLAENLPPGLSINQSTGEISGTPSTPGEFSAIVSPSSENTTDSWRHGYSESVLFQISGYAPIITEGQTATGKVGTAFSFTPSLTDSVIRPVTNWSALGLPEGLSINPTTGAITGTPQDSGSLTIILTATGPWGEDTETVAFSIAFGAPIITAGQSFTGKVGEAFSEFILLTDPADRPAELWSISADTTLPRGLSLNTLTGEITGTPTLATREWHSSTSAFFYANGPGGQSSLKEVDFLILDGVPIITEGQTAAGKVGTAFSFTPSLTDSLNRPVTNWSALGLPEGLSINPTTGAITGTPQDSGSLTIILTATGPGGEDTETATLSIAFGAPIITAGQSFTGKVGEAFSQPISLDDSQDRPASSWTQSGLPAGLALNASTGVITGTPTSAGSFTATFRAFGTGAFDVSQWTIIPITIAEGAPIISYALTPLQLNAPTSILPTVTDATNRPITSWSAIGLPQGLSINASNGEIFGTPTIEGTTTATITATGPGGTDTASISLSISNILPVFAGSARAFAIYAGAAEGKALYYGPHLLWNVVGWEPLPSEAVFFGIAGDQFGTSVAMNSTGNRIIIGAIYNDGGGSSSGSARIYSYDTAWREDHVIYGASSSAQLGTSVAIDASGTTVATSTTNSVQVFTSPEWTQLGQTINVEGGRTITSTQEKFGASISLSADGKRLAVGAPGGLSNGFSSVYEFIESTWTQLGATIVGEASSDNHGCSVALNASGSVLAVGAYLNDANGTSAGHARVFDWDGTEWVQRGSDIDGEAVSDYFGIAVAISDSGAVLAVGATLNDGNGANSGHARVFNWDGTEWVQRGSDIDGEAAADNFGTSVALSSNGASVAVGAIGNDGNGSSAGHVRVFDWDGTEWVQRGSDIDGETAGDRFGTSIALNAAGTLLVAGAPLNDASGTSSGAAKVIPLPPAP